MRLLKVIIHESNGESLLKDFALEQADKQINNTLEALESRDLE